jgi:hypothetical protein
VLVDWDYGAHGIWWVLTKQEREAPAPAGRWSGEAPAEGQKRIRPWSDRLTSELLDDLQEWNDAWDSNDVDSRVLQQRGRDLAIRVQDELGTDDWEVLYTMDGQLRRVYPPGSWPIQSWTQQLLGYAPRERSGGGEVQT